jgi:hypothetical protein
MNVARPLDRFQLVRTHHTEDAREAFARVYSNQMTLKPLRAGSGIDVTVNNCPLPQIGLNYTGYGTAVDTHFSGSRFVTLSFPLRGQAEIAINAKGALLDGWRGLTTSAGMEFVVELSADFEHIVLRLDPEILESKLAALIGNVIYGPLRFDRLLDFSDIGARLLRESVFFLVDQMSAGRSMPRLVLSEFEQTIMMMFLHANRHNYSHLLEGSAEDAAPAEVRRAEEYIEANRHQPITLEDLADVTGVSVLSLVRSFRKYRGYSPMQFAARVRSGKPNPRGNEP